MTEIILPTKIKKPLTTLMVVLDLGGKSGPGMEGEWTFKSSGSQWREQERSESKGERKQNALQSSILREPEN